MADSSVARQHPGNGKKASLQHGIDAGAETDFAGDLGCVNDKKTQPLVDDLLLHRARQPVPHAIGGERAVQQEHCTWSSEAQHVLPG